MGQSQYRPTFCEEHNLLEPKSNPRMEPNRPIVARLSWAARGASHRRSGSLAALLAMVVLLLVPILVSSQQLLNENYRHEQPPVEQVMDGYPYYLQSPLPSGQPLPENQNLANANKQQRSNVPTGQTSPASSRTASSPPPPPPAAVPSLATTGSVLPATSPPTSQRNLASQSQSNNNNYQYETTTKTLSPVVPQQQQQQQQQPVSTPGCLYDKRYFLKLDQCLERRPYPTIGLAAFKNDDLIIKKGLSDKYGCSFILTNGLFKSFQISKYSLDSDTQCLEQDQTSQLSLQFSNVTLYYLWQLRCLNYANQLLDDATLDGKTLTNALHGNDNGASSSRQGAGSSSGPAICAGSSQSFGFAGLQLSNIEAQVELSVDIYKNWRVTNVTVAMMSPGSKLADHQQQAHESNHAADYGYEQQQQQAGYQSQQSHQGGERPATGIKEFTFDTIDGDELNWRYSHLYENWTRNRLHVNFLDQFKRFIWVSLQRCLSESSERLPVKLNDLFGSHKYN